MFAKIEISGVIEVMTGLHIGGSSAFSAIGAVDSPVILDTRSNMPMIPGSSLKGMMIMNVCLHCSVVPKRER